MDTPQRLKAGVGGEGMGDRSRVYQEEEFSYLVVQTLTHSQGTKPVCPPALASGGLSLVLVGKGIPHF